MKNVVVAAFAALAVCLCTQSKSHAQWVTYFSPVVQPAPVVVYRPAPVAVTVARPVVAPVAVTRTRWRPFLGGTVTRTRVGYAPVWAF